MTYQELENEVACLGFSDSVENAASLLAAARRSIRTLYADLPHVKTVTVLPAPLSYESRIARIDLPAGESVTLPLSGGGFSFRAGGEGTFALLDGGVTRTFVFSGCGYEYTGRTESAGSVTFFAERDTVIRDFCRFPGVKDRAKVPVLSPVLRLDMHTVVPDFASFAGPVRSALGYPVEAVGTSGSVLSFPSDFSGELLVPYDRTPALPDPADPDPLDLEAREEHLLPLLVAAYLSLEDEEERASTYFSLYRDGVAALKRNQKETATAVYADVLGWV